MKEHRWRKLLVVAVLVLVWTVACSNPTRDSTDPVERGLGYVAAAILTSGILRLFA